MEHSVGSASSSYKQACMESKVTARVSKEGAVISFYAEKWTHIVQNKSSSYCVRCLTHDNWSKERKDIVRYSAICTLPAEQRPMGWKDKRQQANQLLKTLISRNYKSAVTGQKTWMGISHRKVKVVVMVGLIELHYSIKQTRFHCYSVILPPWLVFN